MSAMSEASAEETRHLTGETATNRSAPSRKRAPVAGKRTTNGAAKNSAKPIEETAALGRSPNGATTPLLDLALGYRAGGIALIPCSHRNKRPDMDLLPRGEDGKPHWTPLAEHPADEATIRAWFPRCKTIAMGTGEASGGVLVLDFDVERFYHAWRAAVGELADGLPVQRTGGGGYQVALRCPTPGKNDKLAWVPDETQASGRAIAVETRADGGYAVLPGSLHPSGTIYEYISGDWTRIPAVSQARADALLAAARQLDEAPLTRQQIEAREKRAKEYAKHQRESNGQGSVIDLFNERTTIDAMLEEYGYTRVGERWVRPGGKSGSVTVRDELSYHHSTNDPMSDGYWHRPFDLFCRLDHGDDCKAAVKAAAEMLGLECQRAKSATKTRQQAPAADEDPDASRPVLDANADFSTGQEQDTRIVHRIETGRISRSVDALEQELVRSKANVYQRSGMLVRINRCINEPKKSDRIKREVGSPVIGPIPVESISELGEDLIRWEKFDGRKAEWRIANLPKTIPQTLAARGMWSFPHLEGVSETPILRPDGTIAQDVGYDEATGYFLALTTKFPRIPDNPSMQDAQAAIEALKEPFAGFPFVGKQHRSAMLAAVLTVIARPAIEGHVPVFGASAPTPRTGKTLAFDVLSVITAGREVPKTSAARNDDEDRKALMAIALSGDPVVLFDNIEPGRPFGSGPLAMAITCGVIKDRILGVSEQKSAPWRATVLVTGNNLQFVADLQQRFVPIMMDAQMEHPEERDEFPEDRKGEDKLLAWAAQHRPVLVSDVLTILRAYVAAGSPDQGLSMFGGFDSWNRLVRNALVWAGETDPLTGRNEFATSVDPDRDAHGVLLKTWHNEFGSGPTTLCQVAERINELTDKPEKADPARARALASACNGVIRIPAQSEFSINPWALGKHLAAKQGLIINGLQFYKSGKDRNDVAIWRVLEA